MPRRPEALADVQELLDLLVLREARPLRREAGEFRDVRGLRKVKHALHRYIIRPRPRGDGFLLSGTRLPYTMRETSVEFALSYVCWLCRDIECASVWVLDSTGYPIIAETIRGEPPRFLGA